MQLFYFSSTEDETEAHYVYIKYDLVQGEPDINRTMLGSFTPSLKFTQ